MKNIYIKHLPRNVPWKAILPAPCTFVQLSENEFYKDKTEFLFKYAQILKEEIENLAKLGFKYVQLSDPLKDELSTISEALRVAVKGTRVKTSLQTFFGDFSQILPEALEFPVDDFGIDIYETDFEKLSAHFEGWKQGWRRRKGRRIRSPLKSCAANWKH